MKNRLTLACGIALFAAHPVLAADEATPAFTKALKDACQLWMEGADRKTLSAKLQTDGWNAVLADAVFARSGSWGRVTATLQQPSGETKPEGNWLKTWVEKTHATGQPPAAVKRQCQIQFSTDETPWSTGSAVEASGTWIATSFPNVERKQAGTVQLEGHAVDGTVWSGGGVKITRMVFQSKQSSPNSDVVLKVENE